MYKIRIYIHTLWIKRIFLLSTYLVVVNVEWKGLSKTFTNTNKLSDELPLEGRERDENQVTI